jgi:glycosyltransferase involved in cell wall biosynthesis
MRVLWVCNIILPKIAQHLNPGNVHTGGGWMTGYLNGILTVPEVTLGVCFPMPGTETVVKGQVDSIAYYGFAYRLHKPEQYFPELEDQFREIIRDFQPDIVHIFGTEYAHSLSAVRAFDRPERTVINIQGLTSVYAGHYMAGVPVKVQQMHTFRDWIRRDNLRDQEKKFEKRGRYEIEALQGAGHIIGRTHWDKACTEWINPQATYHFLNETLRDTFYEKQASWNLDTCERYSLFISRGEFPIKGFHLVLEAMHLLKNEYPQMHLYVSGGDVTRADSLKDRLRQNSYGRYLRTLIQRYQLEENITFTGYLDEKAMCEQFLKSHIFVSPSSVENESNSISEAKLLGVPVIASFVGGVTDRIRHKESGFLYPYDAPYMLAHYIRELFENDQMALRFSREGYEDACRLHDKAVNRDRAMEIYHEIMSR